MSAVGHVTIPFSEWAKCVREASPTFPEELYAEGANSHPFCSTACIERCRGLLGALDKGQLGKACCKALVSSGVFRMLGQGTAADWKGISEKLAQRVGTQVQEPAWLHSDPIDPEQCQASVSKRLEQACCSSEVAVLMLRLAVRTACTDSSWCGPWESLEALQQLVKADAWSYLEHALRALLVTFGADLAKQYNAVNVVVDILHVSQPQLSPAQVLCRSAAVTSKGHPHACADILQPERAAHASGVQRML